MLEICVGAILTQNTNWRNAEKALNNLFANNALSLDSLANIRRQKLAKLIRSSGYYNQKAERLQLFAGNVLAMHGSVSKMLKQDTQTARQELLSLKGIGPETADSMLLYAGRKPVFVVDTYTKRFCSKIGMCKKDIDYHELQTKFHKSLPKDHKLFNEYHALIVHAGKRS